MIGKELKMSSFMLAVSVVFPLVFFMVVGFWIRYQGILSLDILKSMNTMIFKILIPVTLFMNVYKSGIREIMNVKLFGFVFLMITGSYAVTWLITRPLIQDRRDAATVIQGIYRSNYVLFGITIGESVCGDAGIGIISAMAAMVVPLFNILAVVLFGILCEGKVKVSQLLIGIVKNPLVDAGILGIIFSFLQIPLPAVFQDTLSDLGNIASPLALIVLGGMLSFASMKKHKIYLGITTGCRLIIIPLIAVALGILLGFRNQELVAILAVFASPTAVASSPMAQSMGGNGILAGEIVATTSVCCIITLFLFVLVLSGGGYIG